MAHHFPDHNREYILKMAREIRDLKERLPIKIRCEKCRDYPVSQTYVSGIRGKKDTATYLEITSKCEQCNRKWLEVWQRTEIFDIKDDE